MAKGNKKPKSDKANKKPKKKVNSKPSGSIYSRQGDSAVGNM